MNRPVCLECEAVRPRFCPRCTYLIGNMRRWRKVAEIIHAEHCDHRKSETNAACDTFLEKLYNSVYPFGEINPPKESEI
jgi:hypothetical protein